MDYIENQTSVVNAHDDIGYYTHSWHTGCEYSEDVVPWNSLGLNRCPCINCVKKRNSSETLNSTGGLISLHWANQIQAVDELTALREALEYVIRLNENGSYKWSGKTYLVGSKAYERWLAALESNDVDKYFFSLFLEILYEARSHAIKFLSEIKGKFIDIPGQLINEGINAYSEIASRYKILKEMYPYVEPPEREIKQKEQCLAIVKELKTLERKAFITIKEIYVSII